MLDDLSHAVDLEGLLRQCIHVHFIRNFRFLSRVAKHWHTFQALTRSQRELGLLRPDDDFAFLGEPEPKSGLHTRTPSISAQVKQFFAGGDFQEFAQLASTNYGPLADNLATFDRLERLLELPYVNSQSFARTDLVSMIRSLDVILPGDNFFWRVLVRFVLETSQDLFARLQSTSIRDKQGFKNCLDLFNRLVVRDFLERYLESAQKSSRRLMNESPAQNSGRPTGAEIFRIVASINQRVFARLLIKRLYGLIDQLHSFPEQVD